MQYQHYYNAQDAEKLVSSLMFPCCAPTVIRQNKLWAAKQTRPNNYSVSCGELITKGPVSKGRLQVIQDTTFIGLQSMQIIFQMIFQKMPDCTMVYEDSRIHTIPGVGTFVYTPLHLFCSVPVPEDELLEIAGLVSPSRSDKESSNSDSVLLEKRKASNLKWVDSEAAGWNVLLFDENNRLVWRLDNLVIKQGAVGIDSRIPADLVWEYFWGKR
jgi:hypothetical protein